MATKKSIMGPVISVFVMVLVISILAGLTFLFVSNLKTTAEDTSTRTSVSVANETISSEDLASGVYVAGTSSFSADQFIINYVLNATSNASLLTTNVTLTSAGYITNNTAMNVFEDGFKVSYTYTYITDADANAYNSINGTEAAGVVVIGYLPLIFIALIFGAILTLVLKIILPYINIGTEMGAF